MLKLLFGIFSLIGMAIGLTLGGIFGLILFGILCFMFLVFSDEWFS